MPTAVQLTLQLDTSGALSGFDKIKKAISDFFTKTVDGGAGNAPAKSFDDVGQHAEIAGKAITQLTGVVLPRGIENFIAKSKVIGPALESGFGLIVGGTIGVAFVDMGIKAVGAISSIMDSLGGYTDQVKKMQAATIQASQQAFLNPKTLADAQAHLAQINAEISKLAQQQKNIEDGPAQGGGFLASLGGVGAASQAQAEDAEYGQTVDKTNKLIEQRQTLLENMRDLIIKVNQAEAASKLNEAGLQGFALISQQFHDALNTINAAGVQDQKIVAAQYQAAYADMLNARTQLERQGADEVISLRHSVEEESVSGIAKTQQVEADAIEDINRKESESLITHSAAMAERALVTQRAAEQERNAMLDSLAAQRQADLFVQQRAATYLQGSAKIIADAENEKNSLVADYETTTAKLSDLGEIYAAWKQLQEKLGAIDQATNQQLLVNHQQLVDKLHDMQAAAAIAALPEWQRADAQILLGRQKTIEEIGRAEAQDPQNAAVYESQRVAIDAQTNAQIIDAHKQMTEQLGNDLSSVFDDIGSGNIGQRILTNIKKLFAEIVASWLLSTKLMGSAFGQFFGTIVGGPGSSLENMSGGGLLGGLFGGQSSTGSGSIFGASSFLSGSGIGGASAPAAASGTQGLFGSDLNFGGGLNFGGSGALTGSPLGTVAQAATSGGLSVGPLSASKGLSGLFRAGGPALGALGLAAIIGGSKLGIGGTIGGTLLGLALMGQLGGLESASLGALGLAGTGALFGGAIGGGIGFGLGENFGGTVGGLGGAATGALAGFMFGGPIGAILGGLIGLFGGVFGGIFGGGKRRSQANSFLNGTIMPDITQIEAQYKGQQLDYASAIGQLEDLRSQAQTQLHQLKGEGDSAFKNKVNPAINAAEADINGFEAERQRRAGLNFSPPEFHTGGFVDVAMASFKRRPNEMLAVLKHGEFVMSPAATAKNRGALEKMNSGGSALSVGDIHIHPASLDRSYVTSPTGFQRDLLLAIAQLQKQGRL